MGAQEIKGRAAKENDDPSKHVSVFTLPGRPRIQALREQSCG